MDDMTVYIQNLENRTGAWFNLPIDYEEVREKIGLDIESEAYEIQDCDTPFPVDRYTSISEVNRLWEIISDLPEEIQVEVSALLTHFSSLEELSECKDDILIHSDCDDMEDVARFYIDELGVFGEIPAQLAYYIDYQAYGRDLDIEGIFISTNHGIYEIPY